MRTESFHQLLNLVGNKLYTLRHERREKLISVASSIGVSHPVISLIENGRYPGLTIDLLYRLSSYYGISIKELIAEQEEANMLHGTGNEMLMQHLKTENQFLREILSRKNYTP